MNTKRSQSGSGLLEIGPALFVLTLLLFAPLMDLMTLAPLYIMSYHLNQEQVREASLISSDDALQQGGPVKTNLPSQWKASGFGAYSKVVSEIKTDVEYESAEVDQYGVRHSLVAVRTKVVAAPFVNVPFPLPVPGLNTPVTLTFSGKRLMEDPLNAPKKT